MTQQGYLIYQPFEDKLLMFKTLYQEIFTSQFRKRIIKSTSKDWQEEGDQRFSILNITNNQQFGVQLCEIIKDLKVEEPIDSVNLCTKSKSIKQRDDLTKLFNRKNLVITITSKLAIQYFVQGIFQIEAGDFNVIIFEDLSTQIDNNASLIMMDFFYAGLVEGVSKRPVIVSFMSKLYDQPQARQDQLQIFANDYYSRVITLTSPEYVRIEKDLTILNKSETSKPELMEICQKLRYIVIDPLLKEDQYAYGSYAKPDSEIIQQKQRQPYQYFAIEGGGKVILREAQSVLEGFCKVLVDTCPHMTCKLPYSEKQLKQIKIKPTIYERYFKSTNPQDPTERRPLLKPQLISKVISDENGKRYFKSLLITPNCLKDIIYYDYSENIFIRKKDAEGFAAMKVIKRLYQKGFIDKYFFPVREIIMNYLQPQIKLKLEQELQKMTQEEQKENLEKFDPSQRYFKITQNYIQKPLNIKIVDGQLDLHVLVFHQNENKSPIGIIFDRDLSHINSDFEVQLDFANKVFNQEFATKLYQTGNAVDKQATIIEKQDEHDLVTQRIQLYSQPLLMNTQKQMNESQVITIDTKSSINLLTESCQFNTHKSLESFKFFHTYSLYLMQNSEQTFIHQLIKGKFSFSALFFDKEIRLFKKQVKLLIIDKSPVLTNEDNDAIFQPYLVPLKADNNGNFQVNQNLIHDLICHVKTEMLAYFSNKNDTALRYNLDSQLFNEGLLSNLTNYEGKYLLTNYHGNSKEWYKRIYGVNNGLGFQLNNKIFNYQANYLTLQRFLMLNQGSFLNRGLLLEAVKLHGFINYFPSKSLKDEKHEVLKQMIPQALIRPNPIDFATFSELQLTLSHYTKLNELLRVEAFIKEFFSNHLERYHQKVDFNDIFYLDYLEIPQEMDAIGSIDKLLFKHSDMVSEALTLPTTTLKQNYERFEIFGDSVIALLVVTELFCEDQESDFAERTLDHKRIQATNNQRFIEKAIQHGLIEYVDCEPRIHSFRHVTPGGVKGFQKRQKKIKDNEVKERLWKLEISKAQLQEEIDIQGEKDDEDGLVSEQYRELLKWILSTNEMKVKFQVKWPKAYLIYESVISNRNELNGNFSQSLIEQLAFKLLREGKVTILCLKMIILEYAIEKAQRIIQSDKVSQKEEGKTAEAQSQKGKRTQEEIESMTVIVTKDKKLADTLEAVTGAVAYISGLQNAYEFLRGIDVISMDYQVMMKKMKKLSEFRRKVDFWETNYYDHLKLKEVEDILGYEFRNKYTLLTALTHKSYADKLFKYFQDNAASKSQPGVGTKPKVLDDYNILEFMGDSVLNYLVAQYFFHNTQANKEHYTPQRLHQLKSGIVNNVFLSVVLIENGLHNKILKNEKQTFDRQFNQYVAEVELQVKQKPGEKKRWSTKELYEEVLKVYPNEVMVDTSQFNEMKICFEDLHESSLKIFGDIFESLIGAIFLDSLSLDATWKVLYKLLQPYLLIYGHIDDNQEHPRTKTQELWGSKKYAKNLKLNHITQVTRLNHYRELKQDKGQIHYRGYINNIEIERRAYAIADKNKIRRFYTRFYETITSITDKYQEVVPDAEKRSDGDFLQFIKEYKQHIKK